MHKQCSGINQAFEQIAQKQAVKSWSIQDDFHNINLRCFAR